MGAWSVTPGQLRLFDPESIMGAPTQTRRKVRRRPIQDLVRQFHETFQVPFRTKPTANVPEAEAALRLRLLAEELSELRDAIDQHDLTGIADGLGDLAYVLYGSALTFGLPLDRIVYEIHRANMSKVGRDGLASIRDDGKVLKGPNYSPPDLDSLIREAGEQQKSSH